MPEHYTITIETLGAAFEDSPEEVARILRTMADRMESTGILPIPRDINGNKCGSVTVTPIQD